MGDISVDKLKYEVQEILKNADLYTVTSKSVRQQIEKNLGCSLLQRKKEIDTLVMEFVNQRSENDNEEESVVEENGQKDSPDVSSDASSSKQKANKRNAGSANAAARRKAKAAKRKSLNSNDSFSETDDGSDSDYKVIKKPAQKRKKKAGAEAPTGKGSERKRTGFTRAYKLSPELSELMGGESSMPRHEVVKRMWAMIKERNLYDPKNKQFAICDDAMMKVMKVKRFRTFGMLKHLKPHFMD